MVDVLETLRATGSPEAVTKTFEEFQANRQRILGEHYRSDKELAESLALSKRTAETLVGQLGRGILESEAQRDRELRELDAELERTRGIPGRRDGQTDTEHVAVLVRRQIQEQQRSQALTLAAMDLQSVTTSSDPDVILAILEDALMSSPPEAALKLARVCEARVATLAAEETRDGAVPGKAFAAHVQI